MFISGEQRQKPGKGMRGWHHREKKTFPKDYNLITLRKRYTENWTFFKVVS